MNSYHISDLEKITGIKAHTIRIWEKRYKLIEPHRTSTNIRYYDDEQARKLLNISTLLSNGFKISKISILSDKEIYKLIHELKSCTSDKIYLKFTNELISSMLIFDENSFEKTLSFTINRFGTYDAMIQVVYPFLYKVGLMWNSNNVMPVQEHFANNIIRRKLLVAIDKLPIPLKKNKSFLLFLPSEEWHETALLLSDFIIKSKGYKTIYLGQNMPALNLDEVIKSTKPTHLLTFFISSKTPEMVKNSISELSKNHKDTSILISGNYAFDSLSKKKKNIIVLKSPHDLIKLIDSFTTPRKQ